MDDEKLIKSIQSTFKLTGLSITRKCSTYFAKQLRSIDQVEHQDWITRIAEQILSQDLAEPCVTIDDIRVAIIKCIQPTNTCQATETVFNVINAFEIPKIKYDLGRKKYVVEQSRPNLYSEPANKSMVFKERLELLWYRTSKHELFTPLKFGETSKHKLRLCPIEYLLSSSETEDIYIMGVLAQFTERQYYLEDMSGYVKIDLTEATSLITEGSVVIANGNYDDGIFRVTDIGFPPAEDSENTRSQFGSINTFGGGHPTCLKSSEKLKLHEVSAGDRIIIFVSELWLDNPMVLDKFRILIEGYSSCPPIAFVLTGHFLSFPPNTTTFEKMKVGFKTLAEIISTYQVVIKESKFIIVPGPFDPGAPRILPRGPLPTCIAEDLIKVVPNLILATNPCRIQYCTKEIVVFREDILTKICRNTLHFPSEGEVWDHYAKSIVSQSHVAPMSLPAVPVYWKHDQALRLYPTPDLVVVADQFETYISGHSDCLVVNPGIFSKNNFTFLAYVPHENSVDKCAIPTGENE